MEVHTLMTEVDKEIHRHRVAAEAVGSILAESLAVGSPDSSVVDCSLDCNSAED